MSGCAHRIRPIRQHGRKRSRPSARLRLGFAVLTVTVLPGIALAQQRGLVTTQVYLAYNETQQLTLVGSMARSQQEAIETCAPDVPTVELRESFNQWIEENPGFLSRDVVLAFTAAVLDRCREERVPEERTRIERIEEGEWTALPYLLGHLLVEVFDDYTFTSDDPGEEINALFTEAGLSMFALFSRQLYVEAAFSFTPAGEPPPGNNAFENHALGIGVLALTWERERFWITGGKGRPNHGIAVDLAPGIWGLDVLLDAFDVNGRLGLAGNLTVGSERTGHHALYAGAFTADNTFLSRFYLSDGERSSRSDGGPSNTGRLDSFVFTADGQGIPKIEGFRYHVSAMKQAVDRINDQDGDPLPSDQIGDESRLVAALEWSGIEVGEQAAVTPLVEYGRLWNARGLKDRDERFLTASILLMTGRWNVALAGTAWRIDVPNDEELDYTQFQVSGGHSFASGITLEAGYRLLDEFGTRSHTFGLVFSYGLPFAS